MINSRPDIEAWILSKAKDGRIDTRVMIKASCFAGPSLNYVLASILALEDRGVLVRDAEGHRVA